MIGGKTEKSRKFLHFFAKFLQNSLMFCADASFEAGEVLGNNASATGHYLEYSGSHWKSDPHSGNRDLHFRSYRNAASR